MRDFHTVGGGYPKGHRIKIASGGERSEATATLVSERYYLTDAAFTVVLSGDSDTVEASAVALEHPRWAPALGRRSCPPAHPFFLGVLDEEPVLYLRDLLPVVREVANGQDRLVTFIAEDTEGHSLGIRDVPRATLNDWRNYGERKIRRWTEELEQDRFVTDPLALLPEEAEV